jgi:hypothetical protein
MKQVYGFPRSVTEIYNYLYVDYVRTSQKTHLRASTVCYRDMYTFLYVDDIRASQEMLLEPPRSVTGITLLFYM